MQQDPDSFVELVEKSEAYIKSSVELIRLKTIDQTAEIASSLASKIVVILFIAMFFFTLNIGASLWLGTMLGKNYLGFLIISGVYLFLGLLFYIFRERLIKTPVSNSIISQALK
jgi:hypothetical protein